MGVYRTVSTGEERPVDEREPTAPPPPEHESVSRSESRNAKSDHLVPRIPKYSQVKQSIKE